MKKYRVIVKCGYVDVQAESEEEAMESAKKMNDESLNWLALDEIVVELEDC